MSSTELAAPPASAARGLWRSRARRAVLAIVFIAAGGYAGYVGLHLASRIGATRTEIPGQRTVALAAGKYVVYYEPAAEWTQNEAFAPPASLRIKVASSTGGRALPLSGYGGELYVGSTGSRGEAIDTVEIPHSGRYLISTTGTVGPESGTVVLGLPQGTAIIRLVIAALIALAAFTALLNSSNSFWSALAVGQRIGGRSAAVMSLPWQTPELRLAPSASLTSSGALAPRISSDPLDRLAALAALRDRGVLSSEEFDAQKRRILGESASAPTAEPSPVGPQGLQRG